MTVSRWLLFFGLKAGSLWWLVSALALAAPLYYELALPYRQRPGARRDYLLRCLLVVTCASLPGGTLLGASLVLRERARTHLA